MESREPEIVWLLDDRIFAVLVNLGAYFSTVKYTRGGVDYEVQLSNDEFEFCDEYTDYESE